MYLAACITHNNIAYIALACVVTMGCCGTATIALEFDFVCSDYDFYLCIRSVLAQFFD